MSTHPHNPRDGSRIGNGRSGVVYFEDGLRGGIARKVFGGDGASRLVMYALDGAPNPYIWNSDAIAAAVCRRRVLAPLVKFWFGERLRLPETHGSAWDEPRCAFALRSEFIAGCHVPLRYRPPIDREPLDELARRVMRPLQRRLRESGFDGMLWQAGLGNPVAANNFMLERYKAEGARPRAEANAPAHSPVGSHPLRWVWIDLESGVPAIFPLSPVAMLRFYLPSALRRLRPLFDDVDVPQLRRYLAKNQQAITHRIGASQWAEMLEQVDELERRQGAWKSLRRSHRSIAHDLSRGRISEEQADYYRRHIPLWYARLATRAVGSAARATGRALRAAGRWIKNFGYARLLRSTGLFAISQRFRTRMAHRYVNRRLGRWELRGSLSRDEAHRLRTELRHDETSEYLTDFAVHLALKPLVKVVLWTTVPALFAAGHPLSATLLMFFGGPLARTLYTGGRMAQHALRGQQLPWLALLIGLLPFIGALAYPVQLAYRAERCGGRGLPRFIVYDFFAAVGRAVPIWGGADTYTEHFFNRLPDLPHRLIRGRRTNRNLRRRGHLGRRSVIMPGSTEPELINT